MNDNELIPFSEIDNNEFDLNQVVKQGEQMTLLLKKMGIKEATFETGTYFNHDSEQGTSVLVGDGVAMHKNKHTTTVIFRNEGSTKEDALDEVKNIGATQKMLGAFSGKSQQQVSEELRDLEE